MNVHIKKIIVEGIILPNVPLNNFRLIKAAKKLKLTHFRGVFVKDQLPKKAQKEECGIRGFLFIFME